MRSVVRYALLVFLVSTLLGLPLVQAQEAAEASQHGPPSYFRHIWPIIQQRCQGCHQPALQKADLLMTTYEAFKKGGQIGPSFVPGEPENSLVMAYLTGEEEPQMPQKAEPLSEHEIGLFREWIRNGALDDTPEELRNRKLSTEPPVYDLPPVITALAYSPDGNLLATSGFREVLVHKSNGSGIQARLVGISARIQSLQFSSNGQFLMAAGGTPAQFGEIQVWHVRTRRLFRSTTACYDTVFGASYSPDSKKVVFGCSDNTVRVVETDEGEELLKMRHHENWVLSAVFGIDGKRVVSVGRDRAAKLIDAESGAFIENLNLLRGELTALARHPSRDAVMIAGEDRVPYYYLMDRPRKMLIADDSTLIREFERQAGEVFALAFSADGKKVAIAGVSAEVGVYDVETGKRLVTCRGHNGGIYALVFHPDGELLTTGGFDGLVRTYAVDSGRLTNEFIPVPIEKKRLTLK